MFKDQRLYLRLLVIAVSMSPSEMMFAQDASERQWCEYAPADGPGAGKKIVLISGDDEYRSEEALPMLGKILARRHGFHCNVLFPINEQGTIQPNYQQNIPGMHLLEDADLIVLGLRFRNLPDEQMKHLDNYLNSGKPIIGIRTSTHAFRIRGDSKFSKYSFNSKADGWRGGFGQRVFGDTWVNHHGDHGRESTRGVIRKANAEHPVLRGVTDVWGPTDVYEIKRLPTTATVLLDGQVIDGMKATDKPVTNRKNNPMMPLAWVRSHTAESGKINKVFCTTMGASTDFESTDLRRLFVNACYWAVGLEDKVTSKLDVSFVDRYEPTRFGFEAFQKDRRPQDYELNSKR